MENIRGKSYTMAVNKKPEKFEYLTEDISTDVLIVGGGVTGCLLAYFFSKNNIPCVLVEKNTIASGSTSLTTALLEYQLDRNIAELPILEDDVITAYKLNLEAIDEIENFSKKFGNDFYFNRTNSVLFTNKTADIGALKQEFETRINHGFNVSFNTDNNYDFENKANITAFNGGAELDPFLFSHSLLRESKNCKIYEHTEIKDIIYSKKVTSTTDYGSKITSNIVISSVGFSTEFFSNRNFGTKMSTFSIITKPIDDLKPFSGIFRDNESIYTYFRKTHDNRIIIGGEDCDHYQGLHNDQVIAKSHKNLELKLNDMLGNFNIEFKNSGTFMTTKDDLGYIGIDPSCEKLWYNYGFGANGLLFATIGARYLADLYKGFDDLRVHIFKIDR